MFFWILVMLRNGTTVVAQVFTYLPSVILMVTYFFFLSSCATGFLPSSRIVLFGSALLEKWIISSNRSWQWGQLQQRCGLSWVQTERFKSERNTKPICETLETTSLFHVGKKAFGKTVTSTALKMCNYVCFFSLPLRSGHSNPLSWKWSVPEYELLQFFATVQEMSSCIVTHSAWPIISEKVSIQRVERNTITDK